MKKNAVLDFFERNMLTIGLVAVGGYLLYKFMKGSESREKSDLTSSLRTLESQGVKPSFLPAWYSQKASQLYSAMFEMGTDEATIFGVMGQLANDADVYALISAFGSRRPTLTESGALTLWTLSEYLRAELDEEDIAQVNSILAGNGITYRF